MADQRDIQMNFTANTSQAEAAIQRLKGETDKASTSLDKQKTSTVNAGGAVVSFGRIIQDAPFGIIGVANNITMLSEQFVSLKAQAGSTGAALQAMKAGIMGPMGLSIAISVITSGLTMLAMSGHKVKSAVDSATESLKQLAEVRNPFKDMKFFIEPDELNMLLKRTEADLKAAKSKLGNMWLNDAGDDNIKNWVKAMFGGQPLAIYQKTPAIIEMDKLREQVGGLEKYVTVLKEWKVANDALAKSTAFLKGKGLNAEKKNPESPTGTKDFKELSNDLRESILEMIKTDDLLGRLTTQSNFTLYLNQLSGELAKYKEGTAEFNNVLETINTVKQRESLVAQMRGSMANEDQSKLGVTWGKIYPYYGLKGSGISGDEIRKLDGVKTYFPQMRDEVNLDMVKDKNNLLIKEGVKNAKKEYDLYKDYFIDPFVSSFQGEFSKAWQSIFGEANSLLEKFIQSLGESLFNKAVGSAASGILNLLFPGAGTVAEAIFGGGDRATVNNIVIDGELIATQKQATRIKAQLDRQASLR